MPEIFTGPAFAGVTGLLNWAATEGGTFHDVEHRRGGGTGWFQRLVNYIRDRV
jgi:cell division protein FtsA